MKRPSVKSIVEFFLNGLTVSLLMYMAVTLLTNHIRSRTSPHDSLGLSLGHVVPIPGVDWAKNGRSLVFVLSTQCHYCSASAPFYRALLKTQSVAHWTAVGVLPQTVSASKAYMQSKGYAIPTLYEVPLQDFGVLQTPTLLLVDQHGILQQQWIGELSRSDQIDVAQHVGVRTFVPQANEELSLNSNTTGMYSPLINTADLSQLLDRRKHLNILDVRSRTLFAKGHVTDAIDIPMDELEVRMPHEIPPDRPTVVYCHFSASCAAAGVPSLCSNTIDVIKGLGYTDVRVIRDPLPLLADGGIPITGSTQ